MTEINHMLAITRDNQNRGVEYLHLVLQTSILTGLGHTDQTYMLKQTELNRFYIFSFEIMLYTELQHHKFLC